MKVAGCVLILIGGLFLLSGIALAAGLVWQTFQANMAHAEPLVLGESVAAGEVTVDPERACQVAVAFDVQGDAVQEDTKFDERSYDLRYRFPFAYRITDEAGAVLAEGQTAAAWDEGLRFTQNAQVNSGGGMASIVCYFEKFPPPASGRLRVEARLDPDTTYGAEASNPEVRIYDNVTDHAAAIAGSVGVLVVGGLLGLVGFVVFLVGLTRSSGDGHAAG
ncbi:MAG: hypothetical protein ACOCX4_03895, partial [Planctomycetota bacterium]